MNNLHTRTHLSLLLVREEKKPIASAYLGAMERDAFDMYCKAHNITFYDAEIKLFASNEDLDEEILSNLLMPKSHNILGQLYGYPQCCTERFQYGWNHKQPNLKRFKKQLQDLAIDSAEFSCVPYIPCSPVCKETKKREYNQFVQQKEPALYELLVEHTKERYQFLQPRQLRKIPGVISDGN